MRVGVPKEIKDHEDRVGLVPSSVAELVHHGHAVLIERGAGLGAGLADDQYVAAGAKIVASAEEVFAESEMIVKVKEPLAAERKRLRKGQVTSPTNTLPLLTPMSEVAGRLAPQVGAHYLERAAGGRGVLLGGVPGVPPAEVVVLGGGVSGTHAATIALGMGATVFVVDRSAEVLRRLAAQFPGLRTIFSTRDALSAILRRADLLIGAVLVPGAAAPKLVTREMVSTMKPNSVIVDIAIDQGGCCETSKPTSHSHPTYVEEGVIHYCVTNMPGAVARTSTFALNNATLPFALALADKGWRKGIADDPHLRNGLNVHEGKVTCRPVAEALGLPFTAPEAL